MPAQSAGHRLIEDLTERGDPYAITVMIVEAGRIADRLEKLDALLSGDAATWARLIDGRDGVLEVRVDSGLQEARQQVTVLRQVLSEIHRQRGMAPPPGQTDDDLAGI